MASIRCIFGLIIVVNLALGMFTPPVGVNLFAACAVAKISIQKIIPALVPMVLVVMGCVLLVTYVPVHLARSGRAFLQVAAPPLRFWRHT